MNIFVPSAKSTDLEIFETLQISLIQIMNNNGPEIDPRGTPQTIFSSEDLTFPIFTYGFFAPK